MKTTIDPDLPEKTCGGPFDEEMIPLLKELKRIGLKTVGSCAGHCYFCGVEGKSAQLMFDTTGMTVIHQPEKNLLGLYWPREGKKKIRKESP